MTTHPDDRREPLADDGQPIFPPEPPEDGAQRVADPGAPEATPGISAPPLSRSGHSADSDYPAGDDTPAGGATRLLPDSTGYNSPEPVNDDSTGTYTPPERTADDPSQPLPETVHEYESEPSGSASDLPPADSADLPPASTEADLAATDPEPAPAYDSNSGSDSWSDSPADPSPSSTSDPAYDSASDPAYDSASASVSDPASDSAAVPVSSSDPGPAPSHRNGPDDDVWLALQGKFVDDPAQAVREAGDRVERQFSDFRGRLDEADTESLRTAFKQLRDLSQLLR